jgi:hypothetical protein
MPAPADIPAGQLLQLITHAVRLLEADVLPEYLQGQLHAWTLHALSAFRQQIEALHTGTDDGNGMLAATGPAPPGKPPRDRGPETTTRTQRERGDQSRTPATRAPGPQTPARSAPRSRARDAAPPAVQDPGGPHHRTGPAPHRPAGPRPPHPPQPEQTRAPRPPAQAPDHAEEETMPFVRPHPRTTENVPRPPHRTPHPPLPHRQNQRDRRLQR